MIGIFVVLPPLSPTVYLRRPMERLPFPLDEPGSAIYSRARHALANGVRALGLGKEDAVLTPAYHCGAEVEALVRGGVNCTFYDVTSSLEPDETEVERLLTPNTRALFLIHYFGFPQNMRHWRQWCDERRLLLLEDVAHGWLSGWEDGPLGSVGDLAVFSLAKSAGFPDGGVLRLAAKEAPAARGNQRSRISRTVRNHAKWVASRLPFEPPVPGFLDTSTEEFLSASWQMDEPPSRSTEFLLSRLPYRSIAIRRRKNYERLLEGLEGAVPPSFAPLRRNVVPYAFPLVTARVVELQNRLKESGIHTRDWSAPHPLLGDGEFPGARRARRTIVTVPVHQELRPRDVNRIIATARAAMTDLN
jgi:dTDP-4-amino-4,6-dideoxygalactose transaminase